MTLPGPVSKLLWLLVPISALAGLLTYLGQSDLDWNSVRTVIPVSLARGYSPYHPPGEGPLWSNIYPPLAFVIQTPAALASTPLGAIRVGQLISVLFVIGSVVVAAGPRSWGAGLLVGSLAAAATVSCQPLEDVTYLVHVDGIAAGFGVLACAAATHGRLVLAACLAAAAVFSKQTLVPLIPMLMVYLAVFGPGWKASARFAAWSVGLCGAGLGLCMAVFGARAFWYSVVTVSSRHPIAFAPAEAVALAAPLVLPTMVVCLICSGLAATGGRESLGRVAAYPLAALGSAVTGMLGFMKWGGGANNLGLLLVPLLAGALTALIRLPEARWRTGVLLGACLLGLLVSARQVAVLRDAASLRRPSQHQLSFDLVRASPGVYHFPWLPLSHFLGEGRLTHQSWGVLDREKAGEPVPDPWLSAYAPPNAALMCYFRPPDENDAIYLRFRDRYPRRVTLATLPGWTVYTPER